MGFTGVNLRAYGRKDSKPIERSFDSHIKHMLSRKVVRNAKRSFWARRLSLLVSCDSDGQQNLDNRQLDDKLHFQHVDPHFRDPLIVHSVTTPPLISNSSIDGISSFNRTAQSQGGPGLVADGIDIRIGDITDLVMEDVDMGKCEKEQKVCDLQVGGTVDEYHGAPFQEELVSSQNSLIIFKYPRVPMTFMTKKKNAWEDHNSCQTESLGFLQQGQLQHQACILALPAFNHLPEYERIRGHKRMATAVQKLQFSHEPQIQKINGSSGYQKHRRIDTKRSLQIRKMSANYSAAPSRAVILLSNPLLENICFQNLDQKAFSAPFASRKGGQNQRMEVGFSGTVVYEDARDEQMIRILLALQEMDEKVIFMKYCLQLGMRKLFKKREKAIWKVTTNVQ
ncbi:hypothetical protein O6H91_12G007300 [Diphasiastrum complanatum]|uniref:Uncharacterized protein n=3 Tax=Diphasiastrum complanatum TaxID=34168 RepID=A0ACC2BYN8_DIPCM|nr:hypothetical protein O6H91_12G007300 [Diphasiastrum complanatum]KAJ7534861.1 hypothetical protein O6H91_12G007300 [Diphasiastrum complanatum]